MATPKKKPTKKAKVVAKPAQTKQSEFHSVRFNEQTVYWIVFGVVTVALTMWLLSMYTKTLQIYDSIESVNGTSIILAD